MIEIKIDPKYNQFIEEYSAKLDLGGRSNLNENDLAKASRRDFNRQGIIGEIAWREFWYGHANDLQSIIDQKLTEFAKTGRGDGGVDDQITINGYTRIVDVKSSHTENEVRIKHLNLIVPENELHKEKPMIFVAAFTIGKTRATIEKCVLAGFCYGQDIFRRWALDKTKYAVATSELRDLNKLKEMVSNGNKNT